MSDIRKKTEKRIEEGLAVEEIPKTAHVHEWQPNGNVEVHKEVCSPVSRWDDYLYTAVYSMGICKCGAMKKTYVGEKNGRRRGDDLRKGSN